jgi:4-hydroxy-tetrahydrodipicolinate reductase
VNIALIGYGAMGKLIAQHAAERGHQIVCVVDPLAEAGCHSIEEAPSLTDADVAIEFTRPDTAVSNIKALLSRNIPLVVGTTGWYGRLDEVTCAAEQAGASLLWASNFSLGVHLFSRIAAYAAKLTDPFPEYDIGGFEIHHNRKQDSPSGTAKTLVEQVLAQTRRKREPVWETLSTRPPEAEELHFPSLRVGAMPGTHALVFDSPADTIEITHRARTRGGFASGALIAAEWLLRAGAGQKAGAARKGVFTIDDVMNDVMNGVVKNALEERAL